MKLSICMMVKNESKHLEECLKSLQPIRDAVKSELIIVDTGSEDNSVEIARNFTDKVYFHAWNHDFSGMRNISISYGTGEWIFILDGDEVMLDVQPIIDFLCAPNIDKKIGAVAITGKSFTNGYDPDNYSVLVTPRLFRNDGSFHYNGVVHNQPVFNGLLIEIEASLLHYGYISTDKELMDKKFLRTSNLLKMELEKEPENLYYLYQLSVTYGMHEDYPEAIVLIEKAYDLFIKQGRPQSSIFVLTHMAHMYQMTRNYKKVESVCLEAIEMRKGIIDIQYYLAEAQAVLNKYQEAIENYCIYLALVAERDQIIERDTAIIDYTLGNIELVYYNLSNLYVKISDYEQALYFAKLIKKKEYIRDNFKNILFLFVQLERFDEIRHYHDYIVTDEIRISFYQKLDEIKQSVTPEVKKAISRVLYDVEGTYGLLNRMIVEEQEVEFSEETLLAISQLDMEEVPLYCSDILYYLLKKQYPLENLLTEFKEIILNCLMDDIAKHHDDIQNVLYTYLIHYEPSMTISGYKLSKALCRYFLLMNKQESVQYMKIFKRYIEAGSCYLTMVYNESVIKNALVHELKNDEEVFLLFMISAARNKEQDKASYVAFLRKALTAFTAMKTGVEILLQEMRDSQIDEKNEFEQYKLQVKNTIKQLINNREFDEAKTILNQYKSIVPNDIEAVLLESQILLN